jgi:hypothetical protein
MRSLGILLAVSVFALGITLEDTEAYDGARFGSRLLDQSAYEFMSMYSKKGSDPAAMQQWNKFIAEARASKDLEAHFNAKFGAWNKTAKGTFGKYVSFSKDTPAFDKTLTYLNLLYPKGNLNARQGYSAKKTSLNGSKLHYYVGPKRVAELRKLFGDKHVAEYEHHKSLMPFVEIVKPARRVAQASPNMTYNGKLIPATYMIQKADGSWEKLSDAPEFKGMKIRIVRVENHIIGYRQKLGIDHLLFPMIFFHRFF